MTKKLLERRDFFRLLIWNFITDVKKDVVVVFAALSVPRAAWGQLFETLVSCKACTKNELSL